MIISGFIIVLLMFFSAVSKTKFCLDFSDCTCSAQSDSNIEKPQTLLDMKLLLLESLDIVNFFSKSYSNNF